MSGGHAPLEATGTHPASQSIAITGTINRRLKLLTLDIRYPRLLLCPLSKPATASDAEQDPRHRRDCSAGQDNLDAERRKDANEQGKDHRRPLLRSS